MALFGLTNLFSHQMMHPTPQQQVYTLQPFTVGTIWGMRTCGGCVSRRNAIMGAFERLAGITLDLGFSPYSLDHIWPGLQSNPVLMSLDNGIANPG